MPNPQSSWLDACGHCDDCSLLAAGNHPDFHRITRTLNKLHPSRDVQKRKAVELSIDVIRHFLIAKVGLRPSRGRAKVFVIPDAHRLSNAAQNAMLKTLEEPPDHSYLILLALSADTLLATTRSRCQHVAFRALPCGFVVEHLLGRCAVSAEAARFLAELSQGSLGMAARSAELGLHDHLPAVIGALQRAPDAPLDCGKTLLDIAKELTATLKEADDDREDTNAARQAQTIVLAMASTVLRDVQRVVVDQAPAALPKEPALAAIAGSTRPDAIGRAIRALGNAEYQIHRNANTALVFDTVGTELARLAVDRSDT